MEREYDVFEISEGTPLWNCRVIGLAKASAKLHELAIQKKSECFAIHLPSGEVAARVNVDTFARKPFIFQIAYDDARATLRTALFRRHGYEVLTVLGNEAAKVVLSLPQVCDLFLVGYAAPEATRLEMVAWLKTHHPSVPVVALNAPAVPVLSGADFNVKLNGPETLLSVFTAALHGAGASGAASA